MPDTAVTAQLAQATKHFGSRVAVDALDLTLHRGETVALLGPNGAGKTTAIRMLLGVIRPTSGTATVFGRDPRDRATRLRMGAMLQVASVPPTLTVMELVTLFASYYARPLPVPETLAIACLQALAKRRAGDLSGGERQRLSFALAICGDPDFVALDEPSAGLDVETRHLMWEAVRGLVSRGKTLLLTTHYLEEADALADRIVLIAGGTIVAQGTQAELKARVAGVAGTSTLQDAYLSLTNKVA